MNTLRVFVDFQTNPEILEMLRAGTQGHELLFPEKPAPSVLHQAELGDEFYSADVAFGQPSPEAVASATRLKWLHISTSGITRYDNAQFREMMASRRVPVSNSASVYNEACATHVFSFMLAQARCLPRALDTRTGNGTPEWLALRDDCIPLPDQTVFIIGYGAIASRLVQFLQPFNMRVLAFRRHPRGDEPVPVVPAADLNRVMGEADHVINILPDSAETRQFFNHERLLRLKPGAIFYNIGRGTTVDQDALLEMLHTHRLAAAWLDVTTPEPLPDNHPLHQEPNCFITPHTAGGHHRETKTLVRHFLRNFERYTQGRPLLDRVM